MDMTNTLHRLVMEQEAKIRAEQEKNAPRHQSVEEMTRGRRAIHDVFTNAGRVRVKLTKNA